MLLLLLSPPGSPARPNSHGGFSGMVRARIYPRSQFFDSDDFGDDWLGNRPLVVAQTGHSGSPLVFNRLEGAFSTGGNNGMRPWNPSRNFQGLVDFGGSYFDPHLVTKLVLAALVLAAGRLFRAAGFCLCADGLGCLTAWCLRFTARRVFRAAGIHFGAYGLRSVATIRSPLGAVLATVRTQTAFATRNASRVFATGFGNATGSVGAAITRWTTGSLAGMIHPLCGKTNRTKNHCADNQRPKTFQHDETPCVQKSHNSGKHGWATPKWTFQGSLGVSTAKTAVNQPQRRRGFIPGQIFERWSGISIAEK